MNDPWANRHPEWAQREAEDLRRSERVAIRRLLVGLWLFATVATVALLVTFRDRLPEGW